MDREDDIYVMTGTAREARCDARLLGRLGAELQQVYGDMLQAQLPSRLQALIDRLEDALGPAPSGCGHTSSGL